jgi:hypothetical protein
MIMQRNSTDDLNSLIPSADPVEELANPTDGLMPPGFMYRCVPQDRQLSRRRVDSQSTFKVAPSLVKHSTFKRPQRFASMSELFFG